LNKYIGDEKQWEHNPFEAEVVGDNIYVLHLIL